MRLAAWLLIAAVVGWDVGFTLAHRDGFDGWELNPLARLLGPEAACLLRLASFAFAAALAVVLARRGLRRPLAWLTAALAAIQLAIAGLLVRATF